MRMSSATDRVTAALAAAGVTGGVRILDSSARTAALAAEQLGVSVGAIANSLVFSADGEPLLIMTSGAHRVDTGRVAAELGVVSVGRADADFVRRHTGQAIGGVAPVGHPAPIRTVVDRALAQQLGVASIGRSDADFVRQHTGQTIGGVSPVGHPAPIRTVVDRALAQYERIWAAAGHPNTVFPTTYDELVRLTRGTELDVASDL